MKGVFGVGCRQHFSILSVLQIFVPKVELPFCVENL